jgi:DeoR family transcriptional regulator of aga operon
MTSSEPLPAEVRQGRIRSYVNAHEFARVADISERFGVSEVTVRADLTVLEEHGHLRRVHGGAVPRAVHRAEVPFDLAADDVVGAVGHLGEAAAEMVHRGDAVLIDVGTTTTALARALVARIDLIDVVVITNGLTIALELEAAFPRITVVVTGGTLRPMQHSLVNPLGEGILETVNASTAFIGCNGVDPSGGITNVNLPEAEIKRRMVAAARRRVVLAAGAKVGVVELARVCDIDQVDALITDTFADDDVVARIRELGVDVTVVPAPAA